MTSRGWSLGLLAISIMIPAASGCGVSPVEQTISRMNHDLALQKQQRASMDEVIARWETPSRTYMGGQVLGYRLVVDASGGVRVVRREPPVRLGRPIDGEAEEYSLVLFLRDRALVDYALARVWR
jgi:hypothetical protein